MNAPFVDLTFPHQWEAEVLAARPLILPKRHFTYPQQVEEVERGALEIMVRPGGPTEPFLATCALGFRDPIVPTGIWSAPDSRQMCAVSGGYAYLIDTASPENFTMVPCRPVLKLHPAPAAGLLLFIGHRTILAWGRAGHAWESPKLSDEGVTIRSIEGEMLHGIGWDMMTDKETPFVLSLLTGLLS